MRLIYIFIFALIHSSAFAQTFIPDDASSKVSFKIKNFGSTVNGSFNGLKGTILFDASKLSDAKFDVTVNTATIDTGIGMRDNHLRKPDYFGATDFPLIHFVTTKVMASAKPNEAIITGKLTIKKTTKEISFPFSYSVSNGGLQFKGEFKIDRTDFGIGGNSFSLSDEVTVSLDVKASK